MLISARHLVDRLRLPREHADQLRTLRRRLAAAPAVGQATPEELELALRMRHLRSELVSALSGVQSCHGCATGHPLPFGRWPGGHCCGSRTEELFSEDELCALEWSGTDEASFTPPRSELAGCVFRGQSGCSLDPVHRPNLCVRYLCRELEHELAGRPDKRHILATQRELSVCFSRFAELRSAARERQRPPFEP